LLEEGQWKGENAVYKLSRCSSASWWLFAYDETSSWVRHLYRSTNAKGSGMQQDNGWIVLEDGIKVNILVICYGILFQKHINTSLCTAQNIGS